MGSFWLDENLAEKGPAKHRQEGVQGVRCKYTKFRAPEGQCWVTEGGVGWSSGGGLDGRVFTMDGEGMGGGNRSWCGGLQVQHSH